MAVTSPTAAWQEKTGNQFAYDEYMEAEGLPIHRAAIGVADVTALPRAPWKRTGGNGTFIQLDGTFESERGLYVGDIPGGGVLTPQKHLYEEEIFVLEGRGISQVWQGDGPKLTFEWGPGSVFAFPPNTTHVLLNGGPTPVVFMGVTSAPRVMNALYDWRMVFESDYQFVDIYTNGSTYFSAPETKTTEGWYNQSNLRTNFIPDAHRILLDAHEQKVSGGQLTGYRMGPRFPHGHLSEWPTGRYHKAHFHGPGAVLLGLDGEGYVLAWDTKYGARPYQNGHGDEVVKVEWGKNSIYVPPNSYFHQHFNTGAGPARHIAVYGEMLPLGVHDLAESDGSWRGHRSFREGGTLIEYEDEDPQVRADFEAALGKNDLTCTMPQVTYRPD